MSLPTSEPIPDDIRKLPPARRRRSRRLIVPPDADERAALVDELARRATPAFDYFLFSLLAGFITGAALWLGAPVVLVLAAVSVPFIGPLIGLSLATIIGSFQFFARTLGAALLGSLLVFAGGALAGGIALLLPAQAGLGGWQAQVVGMLTQLSWAGIAVLSLGVVLSTLAMARDSARLLLPGVLVGFALYLPLGAAGYGAVMGSPDLLSGGLTVFLIFLAWAVLLGTLTLALLGFRPLTLFGYTLGTTFALLGIIVVVGLSGFGAGLGTQQIMLPTNPPTLTATASPQPLPSETPAPPSLTPTPTRTLVPSSTPTVTITPAPTPIWAVVNSSNGAYIRDEPSGTGKIIGGVLQGALVQVLPETAQNDGVTWVKVVTSDDLEGWIVQALLATATPAPNW